MVTRPAHEAEATRARLLALGHEAILEPMLAIIPRHGPLPDEAFDVVLVTSANALKAVDDRPQAELYKTLPLFAVGRRTAALATAMGYRDVTRGGRDVGALVAHLAAAWHEPRAALYLAGADRSADLSALLAPLGHRVTVVTVYDAIKARRFSQPAGDALLAGRVDAVLHYSARTAEAFLDCLRQIAPGAAPRHLCLSARVAETIRSAGLGRVEVAEQPEEEALLGLLAA